MRPLVSALSVSALIALAAFPALADRSHMWVWKKPPPTAALDKAVEEMNRLLEASGAAGEIPAPVRTATLAWIATGFSPLTKEDGQPFLFPGLEFANRCRTKLPAYDALVTASLLVARDHFGPDVMGLSSSASWAEWADGAALYTKTLGRPAMDPGLRQGMSLGMRTGIVIAGILLLILFLRWAVRRARS